MMYGVAKLFDLFGPDIRQAAHLEGLYHDVRLFEIARAALLTQPTFLTMSPWRDMDALPQANFTAPELLDDVFDILLKCTHLCQRYLLYIVYILDSTDC